MGEIADALRRARAERKQTKPGRDPEPAAPPTAPEPEAPAGVREAVHEGLILPLAVSYDHRVIDGVAGAQFTKHLGVVLSDIRHILL